MSAQKHYIPRSIDDDRCIAFMIIRLSDFHPRLFCLGLHLGAIVPLHYLPRTCFTTFKNSLQLLGTEKLLVHFQAGQMDAFCNFE
jgi:hypothetical protein